MTFDNMSESSVGFSYITALGILFFDFWLYLGLAWYFDKVQPPSRPRLRKRARSHDCAFSPSAWASLLDIGAPIIRMHVIRLSLRSFFVWQVLPKEFGVRRHPLFFLQRSYWCGGAAASLSSGAAASQKTTSLLNSVSEQNMGEVGVIDVYSSSLLWYVPVFDRVRVQEEEREYAAKLARRTEAVSQDLRALERDNHCIHVNGLRKTFPPPAGSTETADKVGCCFWSCFLRLRS